MQVKTPLKVPCFNISSRLRRRHLLQKAWPHARTRVESFPRVTSAQTRHSCRDCLNNRCLCSCWKVNNSTATCDPFNLELNTSPKLSTWPTLVNGNSSKDVIDVSTNWKQCQSWASPRHFKAYSQRASLRRFSWAGESQEHRKANRGMVALGYSVGRMNLSVIGGK